MHCAVFWGRVPKAHDCRGSSQTRCAPCRERDSKYGQGSIPPLSSGEVASSLPARVHRLPRIEDGGAHAVQSM